MKIVWTGAAGFIAGYAIEELLNNGHEVVGVDNFSKYGKVEKSYDNHPRYTFIEGDAKDVELMKKAARDADIIVSGAAMIGGISYFHEFAYDLVAENERITASAFDAAIWAFKERKLKKIIVMSSSMVYESTDEYPSPEDAIDRCPPPISTYGFQKLACEYFAKGAWEQFQLPYTIVRPFNCVGIGEKRALNDKEIFSGNVKLAMSHVVPDLVQKILKGQDPLHILGAGNQVRHYTYGGDLARGIRLCIEKDEALNEVFNISTAQSTTVLELAEKIWDKIHNADTNTGGAGDKSTYTKDVVALAEKIWNKPGKKSGNDTAEVIALAEQIWDKANTKTGAAGDYKPFRYVSDTPFEHDVQKRVPDTSKASRMLGYEATTSLDDMLDEVIPWIKEQVEHGNI